MKNSVQVKAYCKINLSLDIKGLRPDGKHEVDMCMQSVPLFDIVNIKKFPSKERDIKLKASESWVPTDSRNTAYKAAGLLTKDFAEINCGTEIFIDKRVPGCGGLGGSSADAAGVLLGMNELYDLGLSLEQLQQYGAKIGADVPFLLKYGAAIATGTGTDLEYIEPLREGFLLLVNSGAEVSTAQAYKLYDELVASGKVPYNAHQEAKSMSKAMSEGLNAIVGKTKNVLEFPAFELEPSIKKIKEELYEKGAEVSMMSGSGATVFGIFREEKTASDAKAFFEMRGWFTFLCDLSTFEEFN